MKKVLFLLLLTGIIFAWAYSTRSFQAYAQSLLKPMEVVEETEVPLSEAGEGAEVVPESEVPVAESAEPYWWVGVIIAPVPDLVQAQIPADVLQPGAGLILHGIMPESPAEKSELKPYDILLKVNGESIADAQTLVKAVQDSEGKELKLEVLRAGKTLEVALQPEQHEAPVVPEVRQFHNIPFQLMPGSPADNEFRGIPKPGSIPMVIPRRWLENDGIPPFDIQLPEDFEIPEGLDIPEEARQMFEEARKAGGGNTIRLIPAPGIQQKPGAKSRVEIHQDSNSKISRQMSTNINGDQLTISVNQNGDDPANVRVDWNGKVFETTADKLDVIPEEIREKVESFVNSGSITIRSFTIPAEDGEDGEDVEDGGDVENAEEEKTDAIPVKEDQKVDLTK